MNSETTIPAVAANEIADCLAHVCTYFKYASRYEKYDADTARAHWTARLANCTLDSYTNDDEDTRACSAQTAADIRELLDLPDADFDRYARNDRTPGEVREEMPTAAQLRKMKDHINPVMYDYALWLVSAYGDPAIVPEECRADFERVKNKKQNECKEEMETK